MDFLMALYPGPLTITVHLLSQDITFRSLCCVCFIVICSGSQQFEPETLQALSRRLPSVLASSARCLGCEVRAMRNGAYL